MPHSRNFFAILFLPVCLAAPAPAAEQQKSAAGHEVVKRAAGKPSVHADIASGSGEVFHNVVVPGGKSVSLDSTMDYSSANNVAVTVLCTLCTTLATSLGSANVVMQAFWSVPEADLWVAVENRSMSTFAYWDAGGAIFGVYGSQFRLVLQNKGIQDLAIQQITFFRRSQ